MFNPSLKIGQILKNSDIVHLFKCGNMGGMRRSNLTNTLVIVSDYTKGIYHDKWIGGVLHYTGMGKSGDQDIHWAQNATLAESNYNGIDVHLFEVMEAGEYIYCGRIELVDNPYLDQQPGEDGINRKVWMFPVRPVPDNDVKKPQMFVFKDMDDYKSRGKNVDAEYMKKLMDAKKKSKRKLQFSTMPIVEKPEPKPVVIVPQDIVGKSIRHKSFGDGTITEVLDTLITVQFDNVGTKKLGYDFCIKNNMFEYL